MKKLSTISVIFIIVFGVMIFLKNHDDANDVISNKDNVTAVHRSASNPIINEGGKSRMLSDSESSANTSQEQSKIVGWNFDGPDSPVDPVGHKWYERIRAKNVKFDYKVENNQILFSDFFINEKRYNHDYTLGDAPYLYRLGFTANKHLYLFSIYGERSQRHCQLERFVLDGDNVLERSSELTATFPKRGVKACEGMHYPGGFIFDRNEDTITRIGVIMPPVYLEDIYEVARQADPDNFPGKDQGGEVLLSHGEFSKLLPAEQREYIQEIEMNENYVVLMKTNKEPFPEKIRVAWFNIAEGGSLKLLEIKK